MAEAAVSTRSRSAIGATGAQGDRHKWWVLITVVFGAFVSILDNTIVNTAIPKLQAVFGANLHEISYVATGYTLAQGVVVPATGFLANRLGIKRVYIASLTLFTLGSALCGFATSTAQIIFFRVLQGAGGAALFPLSFAILFSTFSPQERGRANGFFGIPVLFAPAIGPTIGGYIVQYVDWRWIFYVNVPLGILGVLFARRVLHDTPPRPEMRFDLPGFLLVASGLGLLLFGLSNLAYDGWNSTQTVSGPIITALVLLLMWVFVELRSPHPLLDLRLFGRRNYAIGNIITMIGTIGIFGPAFLLPQYLQNLRGLSPFPAGQLLFAGGVGTVAGTIIAGQLFNRIGPRILIFIGALSIIGTSLWLREWSTLNSPYEVLPWILFIRGLGLPIVLQSANTSALDGINGRALPGATTLNVVARSAVAALSIAVLTNLLQTWMTIHRRDLTASLPPGSLAANGFYTRATALYVQHGLPLAQAHMYALGALRGAITRQASALGFQDVYLVAGIASVPILALGCMLSAPRGTRGGIPHGAIE